MFRRRESKAVASPRAMLRPPPTDTSAGGVADDPPRLSSLDAADPTMGSSDSAENPAGHHHHVATDSLNSEGSKEIIAGKAVIRPAQVEPVPRKNFFSRFSLKRNAPVTVPTTTSADVEPRKSDDLHEATGVQQNEKHVGLERSSELEVIARIAERRGWGKTFPTNNPHVLHVLLREANPFRRIRHIEKASVNDLVTALEGSIYAAPKGVSSANNHRFQRGDVVVCGSVRSGETPVLQILASLKGKKYMQATSLVDATHWVEGPFTPGLMNSGRTIYKTHMPLSQVLKGVGGRAEHKIICVLRDPVDVRLSWARHVRRLVKKCCQQNLEQKLDTTAFAESIMPVPLAPQEQVREIEGREPEFAIAWAVQAAREYPENVLLVFYEEILTDPFSVVERIARFTRMMGEEPEMKRTGSSEEESEELPENAWKREQRRLAEAELIASITNNLMWDPAHPNFGKRNGSAGQGSVCFTRDALDKFDDYWEQVIKQAKVSNYQTYAHLYQSITKERYYFAGREKVRGTGSGGLFARMSNLSMNSDSKSGRQESTLGSNVAASTRLKKNESSNDADHPVGRQRKLGGSFLSIINPKASSSEKDNHASSKQPQSERPMIARYPSVFACIDPDDSDDEASKNFAEFLKGE